MFDSFTIKCTLYNCSQKLYVDKALIYNTDVLNYKKLTTKNNKVSN